MTTAMTALTWIVYLLASVMSPFVMRSQFHKMLDAPDEQIGKVIKHALFTVCTFVLYMMMCVVMAQHVLHYIHQ